MIIIQLLFFLILSFSLLYLPGRYIVRKTGYKQKHFVITAAVSLGVGYSAFLLFTYLLSWIQLSFVYFIILIPVIFLEWKKTYGELVLRFTKKNLLSWEAIIIYIGTGAMTYLTWRSGSIENGKLVFFGIHAVDSIYHQSLIGNLIHSFPPTHPGISGIPLRGYNFFYDFITVQFAKYFFLDRFDLFFRFVPLLTSFFYGLAGLSLTRVFQFNKIATLTTLYLLYFAQNFSFFFRMIPDNVAANFNFEIIQSFGNIHDPSVIFSSILIFLVTITLSTTKHLRQLFIPAIMLGVIPTMKIHAGVIAFIPAGILTVYVLLFQRKITYLVTMSISGLIAAVTYLPINFGAGHLIFSPFHLYRHYMDSAPMFKNAYWPIQYEIFKEHNNYLRMGFINIVVMICYLMPNLGIRLVSFFLLPKLFQTSSWNYQKMYFTLAILTSFLIPTLFIQSVYSFVIIQCLWIASILLVFPTASVLASFVQNKNRYVFGLYLFLLFILTLPATISELYHHSVRPYEVPSGVFYVSRSLSEYVGEEEAVFVINRVNTNPQYVVPLVSALSGRSVYSEPEVLEFANTADEIQKRTTTVDTVSRNYYNCDSVFDGTDVPDLTEITHMMVLSERSCQDEPENLEKVKTHEGVVLYKISNGSLN